MTLSKSIIRTHFLTRTAQIVFVAALTAGCSAGTERFGDQFYTGSTQNQKELLGQGTGQPSFNDVLAGPSAAAVSGAPVAVNRANLPPVADARAAGAPIATGSINAPVNSAPKAPSIAAAPASASPVAVVSAPEVRDTVVSKGWSTAGGTRISARTGDSVETLSRRYGVPGQVFADVNGISPNAKLSQGQSLIVPTYVYGSRDTPRTQVASATRLAPVSGEPSATGSISAASVSTVPRPLVKPATYRQNASTMNAAPVATPAAATASARVAASLTPKPKPTPPTRLASASQSVRTTSVKAPANAQTTSEQPVRNVSTAPAQSASQNTQLASVQQEVQPSKQFRWPVRGRIISDFGSKPGGARNDGINLAVPEGTEVKAAEDGSVIYAGNELKGYGNLVLIRHDDGWVSAYAHNSEILVKRGDTVRRGDTISRAGASGSVSQPQVHFELRKGNKPVNPMLYLSQS